MGGAPALARSDPGPDVLPLGRDGLPAALRGLDGPSSSVGNLLVVPPKEALDRVAPAGGRDDRSEGAEREKGGLSKGR